MTIDPSAVSTALRAAGIGHRVWLASVYDTNHRVYITDAGLQGLGVRALNQRRKLQGAYIECATDEALVQGCGGSAEAALIAILTAAGVAAR